MKLHTAPASPAEMSGVLETTQFAIKTSAKAFEILSSGLYANKIRAIVRELSCNAYDSHVSAGKADIPFDVHLPTALEPYFSVRDYGIGLAHNQVVSIFTTYFESTKTDSNELIGGLGLGSKAPFSYTSNFTVTAIKDKIKGVYSAFVSDEGVPSIALLSQFETDEINGVEIQFSVENQYDFRKFYEEAERVFEYFAIVPTFTGHDVTIRKREYETKNVAPGIHIVKGKRQNVAVMGNIAYPIDVPNADKLLKELVVFNDIGLEINFDIGDIEFQASREGLSYTPRTIQAICDKYSQFAATLEPAFLKQVLQKKNAWERAWFIQNMCSNKVWSVAAKNYVSKHNYPHVKPSGYHAHTIPFKVNVEHLAKTYNINLTKMRVRNSWNSKGVKAEAIDKYEHIHIADTNRFMVNDRNRKIVTRLREHVSNGNCRSAEYIYVLSPKDSKQPMQTDKFFALIKNPPERLIFNESVLPTTAKSERPDRTVQLIRIKQEAYNYEYKWTDEYYEASDVDGNGPFYYIPIKGFAATLKGKPVDVKEFVANADKSGILRGHAHKIFGVRSGELEAVQQDSRFKLLEDALVEQIATVGKELIYSSYLSSRVNIWLKTVKPDSANSVFAEISKKVVDNNTDISYITSVCKNLDIDIEAVKSQAKQEVADFLAYYPLLKHLDSTTNEATVKEYINLVDKSKE